MVSGGVGALAATAPVEFALGFTDWRGVFLAVSLLTLLAAGAVFWVVPEKGDAPSGETLREQFAGIGKIFTNADFWRIAPWAITAQSAYLSIFGLWSGPWLRDVAGYDRMSVANALMGVSVAMIFGYYLSGALAERLSRRGIRPMTVAACGMCCFMGVQLSLLLPLPSLALPLWLLFGFFGTFCILPYAVLSQTFPKHLSGRANTALNVMVFLAAFSAQWAIGVIIGFWPETAAGGYSPSGYSAGFGLVLALQTLAAAWFLLSCRRNPDQD